MAGQSRGTGSVPALLSSLNERGARRFVSNTHRSPGRRSVAGWSSYRGSSDSVIVVVVSCLEISPDGRVIALSVLLCSQSPDLAPRLRQLLSRERPPPVGPGRRLKRRIQSANSPVDTGSGRQDCETVGIPPLMSTKTLGILDGGRGGYVDRLWRRRGIIGVDKGGA